MSDDYIPSDVKSFQEGDVIFYEGDRDKDLFIITSGHAEVVKNILEDEVILAQLHPGDFFGEMAMFSEAARTATVRAAPDLKAIVISEGSFKSQIKQLPDWFGNMFAVMVDRLREMNNKVISQFKYGLNFSVLQLPHLISVQYGTYTENSVAVNKEFLINRIHMILGVAHSTLEKYLQNYLGVQLIEIESETDKIIVKNNLELDQFLLFYNIYIY